MRQMDPANHLYNRKEKIEYGTDMDPADHLIDRKEEIEEYGRIQQII